MKLIFATFFIVTVTSFSQTQLEMDQAFGEKYLDAVKEMDRVYNQILIEFENDTNFIEKLEVSQQLWIKFRDAELEMKFPESDKRYYYGSVYPMCAAIYLEHLTKERTKKLMEWLTPIPEGDVCQGSIKHREINENDISIEKIENFEIQELLNGIEILKEFKTAELSVRIMALGNLPGSAGFVNGEITHDLFIAVSEFDELPKQNLFRISELYNPKFESIEPLEDTKLMIEISFGKLGERERIKFELTIDELIKISR